MFKEIKDILIDYSIVGVFMAMMTSILRPFVNIRTTITNGILTYLFATCSGLLLEYFDLPIAVKYGLSGMASFYALQINDIIKAYLKKVENNPEVIEKIKK